MYWKTCERVFFVCMPLKCFKWISLSLAYTVILLTAIWAIYLLIHQLSPIDASNAHCDSCACPNESVRVCVCVCLLPSSALWICFKLDESISEWSLVYFMFLNSIVTMLSAKFILFFTLLRVFFLCIPYLCSYLCKCPWQMFALHSCVAFNHFFLFYFLSIIDIFQCMRCNVSHPIPLFVPWRIWLYFVSFVFCIRNTLRNERTKWNDRIDGWMG